MIGEKSRIYTLVGQLSAEKLDEKIKKRFLSVNCDKSIIARLISVWLAAQSLKYCIKIHINKEFELLCQTIKVLSINNGTTLEITKVYVISCPKYTIHFAISSTVGFFSCILAFNRNISDENFTSSLEIFRYLKKIILHLEQRKTHFF